MRIDTLQRCREVRHESGVGRRNPGGRAGFAEKLRISGQEAFAGVGAGREIDVWFFCRQSADGDGCPRRVQIELLARQTLERLFGDGRNVPRVAIEKSEHVVERSVLEHQYDDVLDRPELVSGGCHEAGS